MPRCENVPYTVLLNKPMSYMTKQNCNKTLKNECLIFSLAHEKWLQPESDGQRFRMLFLPSRILPVFLV